MARSPVWKVYDVNGEYTAATKSADDAAMLVGARAGGTVRYKHRKIVWREGHEEFSAADSWDGAAMVMVERLNA